MYMNGRGASVMLLYLPSRATPTTCSVRAQANATADRVASRKYRLATVSLTMTTSGRSAVSRSVNSRPATRAMPIVFM